MLSSSSLLGPRYHNYQSSMSSSKGMNRSFGTGIVPAFQILPSKRFTNPNYVNKYQKNSKLVDSSAYTFSNFRQKNIIDSIKEQCPKAIPNVEENSFALADQMCYENSATHKQRNKEHTIKQQDHMGKKSRQNLRKKEISDSMEENPKNFTCSYNSLTIKPEIIQPHSFILEDFIVHKPISSLHKVIERKTQLELPKNKGKEMIVTITSLPLNRTPQHSFRDSEDQFIIFDHSGKDRDNDSNVDELPGRARLPSLCESEDSFVVFEKDDLQSLDDDEESIYESSSDEEENSDVDEVDFSFNMNPKKVRFASNDKLCEVHPMIKWSYAYQAARKGPWEMYARDRSRFKERALRVERDIKHIFDPQHRAKIYKERFENL